MMALPEWMTKKREDVLAIATKHGACHIRVFGSVARGNPQPDSDIDFLVDMQQGRSLVDLGEILMELRDVDVVTEAGLRPRIRGRVLKEAVPL